MCIKSFHIIIGNSSMRIKDDNKFADWAVSCNADYLVTNDRHYDVLSTIEFPDIRVIKAAGFLEILKHPVE